MSLSSPNQRTGDKAAVSIAFPFLVFSVAVSAYVAWYEMLTDPPTVELLDRCERCRGMMGWKHQYQCVESTSSTFDRIWTESVDNRTDFR